MTDNTNRNKRSLLPLLGKTIGWVTGLATEENVENILHQVDYLTEKNEKLLHMSCLLYTSDAADDLTRVDLGGRRIIKKIFFKQKTAYEIASCLVGSEMCIRDRDGIVRHGASPSMRGQGLDRPVRGATQGRPGLGGLSLSLIHI